MFFKRTTPSSPTFWTVARLCATVSSESSTLEAFRNPETLLYMGPKQIALTMHTMPARAPRTDARRMIPLFFLLILPAKIRSRIIAIRMNRIAYTYPESWFRYALRSAWLTPIGVKIGDSSDDRKLSIFFPPYCFMYCDKGTAPASPGRRPVCVGARVTLRAIEFHEVRRRASPAAACHIRIILLPLSLTCHRSRGSAPW